MRKERTAAGHPQSPYLGNPRSLGFDSKKTRSHFVVRVLTVLLVQLCLTVVLICAAKFNGTLNEYLAANGMIWSVIVSITALIPILLLMCSERLRRTWPTNMVLLFMFSTLIGILLAIMSIQYSTNSLLMATLTTTVAVLSIVLLAKFSTFDMTTCGCALFVLSLVHFALMIIIFIVWPPTGGNEILTYFLACFGALLASLYLMFDLQLIMGGRSLEISPEDWPVASICLYLDIVSLFQNLLFLLGND